MADQGKNKPTNNPLVELLRRFSNAPDEGPPRLSPTKRRGTGAMPRERGFPDQKYERGSSAKYRNALQPDWKIQWGSPFQAELAHPNDPSPPMAMGTSPTDRVRAFHAERALRNLVSRTRGDINAQGYLERLILDGDVGNKAYTPLKTPAMRDTRALLRDLAAPDMEIRRDAWYDADMAKGAGIHHPFAEQAASYAQILDEARQRADSVLGPQIRDSEARARKMNPPRFAGTGETAGQTLARGGGGMVNTAMALEPLVMAILTGQSPISTTLATMPSPSQFALRDRLRSGEFVISPSGRVVTPVY